MCKITQQIKSKLIKDHKIVVKKVNNTIPQFTFNVCSSLAGSTASPVEVSTLHLSATSMAQDNRTLTTRDSDNTDLK